MQCCFLEVNFFPLAHPKMEKAANGAQPKDSLLVPRHIWVLSLNVVPSSSRPALATVEWFERRSKVEKKMTVPPSL